MLFVLRKTIPQLQASNEGETAHTFTFPKAITKRKTEPVIGYESEAAGIKMSATKWSCQRELRISIALTSYN